MKLLKHPKMIDVAMCVVRNYSRPNDPNRYLNVHWFNIVNPNNIFDMGVKEYIVMLDTKLAEFEEYVC